MPNNDHPNINRRQVLQSLGALSTVLAVPNFLTSQTALDEHQPPHLRTAQNYTHSPQTLPPLAAIVLNRTAYGPRPGTFDAATFNSFPGATDSARLANFIDWQLNPETIDDNLCDSRLAAANLSTLTKSLIQLWADHHESPNGERTLPVREVIAATLIRSVYSQRQLFEVITAFWHNHFNVYAWDFEYASSTWVYYDRDVIRANAFGNFRAMLGAVATSPAMLYYLNNNINQAGGPNENWAREVFELHTMGAENYLGTQAQSAVPGYPTAPIGFVDPDIFEATRCFTGWRVNDGDYPLQTSTGEFYYHEPWHDHFQKTVLGQFFAANSAPMADGIKVLDMLAAHPGTARFISRKLCRRLIGDDPPLSVVNAAAAEFSAHINSPDQIKRVLRVILLSDAFQNTFGEKLKQPQEAAISMLRGINADFTPSQEFIWNYEAMGQPMFEHRSPDGYPDVKEAWSNTTSFLKRWQIALSITENTFSGISTDIVSQMPGTYTTANAIVDFWIERLLGRPLSAAAQRTRLVDFMRGPYSAGFGLPASYIQGVLPRMTALILMCPDFQYR